MSHPKKIRPIRAIRVRKKYIFAYVFYSFDHESPESHEYIPCRNLQDSSDSSDSCSKNNIRSFLHTKSI